VPHEGTSDQGTTNRQATNVIYRDQQHISPPETILGHSSIRYWSLCEERVQRLALLHSSPQRWITLSGNLYLWKLYPYASQHYHLSTLKMPNVSKPGVHQAENTMSSMCRVLRYRPKAGTLSMRATTKMPGIPRCATPSIGQQG
jgi:hypothetical protein